MHRKKKGEELEREEIKNQELEASIQ